ncbi:NUDIX domain-containing protein [Paracoccus sp. S-4012]|uniref:NUDIX domain-containing protein n=1 Tax=Paracoccus sp. S-4012 TaxID=2665648 RepID=UPI0012B042A2|nr:NUDIX hydrolase [Paracoccus sp. S-4012]MRX49894.1 NUDIX domain-containing protein [Paracoccus sp. S-4012]
MTLDAKGWDGADFRGAKVILICGDAILVMRRDDIPTIQWPGQWDLPGGKRDGDESPARCVLRELEEETGLRLAPERLVRGEARPSVSRRGGIGWYFVAEITPAEAASVRLGDEGSELRLMPVAEFLADAQAIAGFKEILREMLD